MLKLIGGITCGALAACGVAYVAMRPTEKRAQDVEQTKSMLKNAVSGVKSYFKDLVSSKPEAPQTNA